MFDKCVRANRQTGAACFAFFISLLTPKYISNIKYNHTMYKQWTVNLNISNCLQRGPAVSHVNVFRLAEDLAKRVQCTGPGWTARVCGELSVTPSFWPPRRRVSLCPHKKCEEAAVRPQRHGHLTTGEEGQPPWTDPLPRLPQLATLTAGPALTAADLWH